MYIYARLIAASFSLLVLQACAHPIRARTIGTASDCLVGTTCTIEGEILIYRGSPASVAEIRTPGGCVAAALDDRLYRESRRWNGHQVRVSGRVYQQAYAEGVVSYELNGRDVATGICVSGPVVFVEELLLRNN